MTYNQFARATTLAVILLVAACGGETVDDDDYVDRTTRAHEGDTAQSNVQALAPMVPVTGAAVIYGEHTGFEAYPEQPDSVLTARGLPEGGELPGVILIHEWWGLNDDMRASASRLAGEGFRVLAVDLFRGRVARDPDQASAMMREAMRDEESAMANLGSAYAYLAEHRGAPTVAVMGYCFGGAMALNTAMAIPEDLDALVIYYGRLTDNRGALDRLDMPILGIFGAEDDSIPVDQVQAFEETLRDLEKTVEIHVFEGAGHAFANVTGTAYVPDAAERGWTLTSEFLTTHLYDVASAGIPTARE